MEAAREWSGTKKTGPEVGHDGTRSVSLCAKSCDGRRLDFGPATRQLTKRPQSKMGQYPPFEGQK